MKHSLSIIILLAAGIPVLADDASRPKSTGSAQAKFERASSELRARYLADLEKLQEEYIKDLTAAHAEAVKRKDLVEAQLILEAINEVVEAINSQKVPRASVALKKGSAWHGTHTSAKGIKYPATLTIASRSGEQFQGTLEWQHKSTGHVVALVEGKINGDEVVFEMKKVQKGKKVVFPVTYTGKLVGKSLQGNWHNQAETTKGAFSYTQQQ